MPSETFYPVILSMLKIGYAVFLVVHSYLVRLGQFSSHSEYWYTEIIFLKIAFTM